MRKQILDIDDVARMKKVHPGTVYHWVASGILKPIRIGRSLFFTRAQMRGWRQPDRGRKSKQKGGDGK